MDYIEKFAKAGPDEVTSIIDYLLKTENLS